MTEHTFSEFTEQMRAILCPTAVEKGYNTTGVDGHNELYEFVHSFAGDGHALGEIVYKAKRYAAKGDPTELVKMASWAFLLWRHRAAPIDNPSPDMDTLLQIETHGNGHKPDRVYYAESADPEKDCIIGHL